MAWRSTKAIGCRLAQFRIADNHRHDVGSGREDSEARRIGAPVSLQQLAVGVLLARQTSVSGNERTHGLRRQLAEGVPS